jgi:diguanylate cyclase (GGDEF)-like protein
MASCGVIVATSDQTDGMRPYVDGQEPCVVGEPSPSNPVAIDHGAIITSVGEVAYEWRLDTDAIVWGANVGEVLPLGGLDAIATGRGFAQCVEPDSGRSRAEAVSHASAVDQGRGVPYELQYALRLPNASALSWVEDIGRWFAGADGRPLRAHGVLRVINERHEREERLAYLSHFDALTGEINRWHLTELLEASIAEATKLRSSCGFLLAAIDNLGSINRAYGYDIADEVITAVAKRIHSQLRAKDHLGRYSGNKFGLILNNCTIEDMRVAAERVLATTRDQVVSTSVGPVAVTVTVGGITAPRHARGPQSRSGSARCRESEAARLVCGLPAQSRAGGATQGERAGDRRHHQRAQRPAGLSRLRAGRGRQLKADRFFRVSHARAVHRRLDAASP